MHFVRTVADPEQTPPGQRLMDRRIVGAAHRAEYLHGAVSDPLQRPGSGTVQCNGQQPNPCVYTPTGVATSIYDVQSGIVVGPDGVKYSVANSSNIGEDGWKDMLTPAG